MHQNPALRLTRPMTSRWKGLAGLALALGVGVLTGAPALANDAMTSATQDDAKPDKRKEVQEACAKLKAHIKERGKQDQEAVQAIDGLIKEFAASGPKDREAIVKALGECFKQTRKPNAEGVRDNKLFMASAAALGEMGPESVAVLADWIGHKDHRDDLALQRQLILSLGKTKDKGAVKPLIDLLVHHQSTVQAATAEALANFGHLPLADRKVIFEAVLKEIGQIKGAIDSDPNNTTERERYDAVRAPMRNALQVMSKQDFAEPSEWRTWWNNNKNKDWDNLS